MPEDLPAETWPSGPVHSASGRRRVFLVHGRDRSARTALVALLKAFGLEVIDWREASAHAGGGTPYTGDIVAAGMDLADAVVVLLTPDDIACVRPVFREETDGPHELEPTGQARLNVVFEAGMAIARDRDRVVLVEVGQVRRMSDIDGLHIIRMHDSVERRKDLAQRLESAGLAVNASGEEWMTAGRFNRRPLSALDSGAISLNAAPLSVLDQSNAEYHVLRRIVEQFSQPDARPLRTPFAVPGMTWDQIAATLRDLAHSRPPCVTGISVEELDYPAVITGITARGREKARQVPESVTMPS